MAAAYPSQGNVVVKSMEASGKLLVDFARDPKKFDVLKYAQIVPVKKTSGLYLKMTVEEAGRILYNDGRNFVWYDGQPAPEGNDGTESFEYESFYTKRYAYPTILGDLTVDMADWNILAQMMSIKARQAMTMRTQLAITALTTSSNYDASHYIDVTAISGSSGSWIDSTTARQDIKRSIITGMEKILDDTLAAIDLDDLLLVINSTLAGGLIQCQEIVDYIKGSPDALAQIRGELPGKNAIYGLPDKLYGVPLVVEKTRKVTSKKGATRAVSSVLPTATPFLCSRPGGLKGTENGPNFSTCVIFCEEEMTVEQIRQPEHRRVLGRVVENLAA
jgi:hypothetical protein